MGGIFFNFAQSTQTAHRRAMRLTSTALFLVAACTSVPTLAQMDNLENTGNTGGNQSFPIVQPSLSLTYFVPLSGLYPSQDGGFGNPGEYTLGNVRMFAGNFAPGNSLTASGQTLPISGNEALFSLFGTMYGGDGETVFNVPDLSGRAAVGAGNGPGLSNWNEGQKGGSNTAQLSLNQLASHNHTMPSPINSTQFTGGSQPFDITQPSQALNYVIANDGVYPDRNNGTGPGTFTGQVALFAGNYEPRGWSFADGRLISIQDNVELFSLIGTTYGGDGRTTFGLPDLRGRVPVHAGNGPGLIPRSLGNRYGAEEFTLNTSTLPSHNHTVTDNNPTGFNGGSQSFSPAQPSLGLNHLIALEGIYPSEGGGIPGETLLGEVALFAGNFAPRGWAFADGQLLPISQYEPLFSLLGTIYGGDGETTFALPDLRGRTAVNAGNGPGLGPWPLGDKRGTDTLALSAANIPAHHHAFINNPGDLPTNPIASDSTGENGELVFTALDSNHWIAGPPSDLGYEFATTPDVTPGTSPGPAANGTPGSHFTAVTLPSSASGGPFEVWVSDVMLLGTFTGGTIVFSDFFNELGDLLIDFTGVESFRLVPPGHTGMPGTGPPSATDPLFPIQLGFSTPTANVALTLIPEPGSWLLLVGSLVGLRVASRHR